ncbi:hypothetical protein B566_EDAN015504 [Ephemera danica]|nr:hypothetical protein B566_EDAN015504 [Ephemera danica]
MRLLCHLLPDVVIIPSHAAPILVMHTRRSSIAAVSGAVLLLSTLLLVLCSHLGEATDSGTFFLKATKNVPRIGRRSGSEDNNFFLKASKNVPRIGRRDRPWGASLTEMRPEIGGMPVWFRNQDSVLPNRVTRMGPASLYAALWDGPSRYPLRSSAPSQPALYPHYDVDEDEELDVSAAQLLAPPPPAHFPRLPQEGSLSRQTRAQHE